MINQIFELCRAINESGKAQVMFSYSGHCDSIGVQVYCPDTDWTPGAIHEDLLNNKYFQVEFRERQKLEQLHNDLIAIDDGASI